MAKVGDRVTFHILTAHTCAGKACACTPDLQVPATIVHVWPPEGDEGDEGGGADDKQRPYCALELELPDHVLAKNEKGKPHAHEMADHQGRPHKAKVTTHGFISRQSHARQATTIPPESGTFTPSPVN
jgi:hypothetical protein